MNSPNTLKQLLPEQTYYAGRAAELKRQAQQQAGAGEAVAKWSPIPNSPQELAYNLKVDVLGYGGAAGGGKSDLLLGLAGTNHKRSIIFRRIFPSLRGMIERSREIYNAEGVAHADDSFNEQLHRWRLEEGKRLVEFGSVQYEADKKKYQGQPHDFIGIDEAPEFPEMVVRFLTAWNRTAESGQRCMTVLTFNPPMDDSQEWIVKFFAPWLDKEYADPAMSGEIRHVHRSKNLDIFYRSPEDAPEEFRKHLKTRAFVRAHLQDNPYLLNTGYESTILSLPEHLSSILQGNFEAGRSENLWQTIPTEWVKAAQARWTEKENPGVPDSVGLDPSRGGDDETAKASLYGEWFSRIKTWPGKKITDGPTAAALVLDDLLGGAAVGIDVIGIGSSVYDSARDNGNAIPVNFAESAGDYKDRRTGKLKFRNVRAAAYWNMREALDPDHGDNLALPPDPELRADLCEAQFKVTPGGIILESKDGKRDEDGYHKGIKERLGRSPNKGDATVIALWVNGSSSFQAYLKRLSKQKPKEESQEVRDDELIKKASRLHQITDGED